MPNFSDYKTRMGSNTVGKAFKSQSDMIMEATWYNDLQAVTGYLYDYYHDDKPTQNKNLTYENTTKMEVEVKYIIDEYGSMSKDSVAAYIQFKPSFKVRNFTEKDELYYYQTDFTDKYDAKFPVGLYIDLPDEQGIYEKYLICKEDVGHQFIKYFVLKADYLFQWIEEKDNLRIKRCMYGCTRSQSSYNSGSDKHSIYCLKIVRYF